MSEHSGQLGNPLNVDLHGHKLSQILPELTNDTRAHVAARLSCSDRARCLMLTASVTRQEGTPAMRAFQVIVQLQSQTLSKDFVQQCRQYSKRLVSNVAIYRYIVVRSCTCLP